MTVDSGSREFVCAACINEEYLQTVVNSNLTSKRCDYCDTESSDLIACDFETLLETITDAIGRHYGDPDEVGVPYDSREGGYQLATIYDSQDMGLCPDNWTLFEDIDSHFSDSLWCEKDYILLSPTERKSYGWKKFKKVVANSRRYTFWTAFDDSESEHHPDYLPLRECCQKSLRRFYVSIALETSQKIVSFGGSESTHLEVLLKHVRSYAQHL